MSLLSAERRAEFREKIEKAGSKEGRFPDFPVTFRNGAIFDRGREFATVDGGFFYGAS